MKTGGLTPEPSDSIVEIVQLIKFSLVQPGIVGFRQTTSCCNKMPKMGEAVLTLVGYPRLIHVRCMKHILKDAPEGLDELKEEFEKTRAAIIETGDPFPVTIGGK